MFKHEKCQNINKSAEERAVEIYEKISMGAKLIGKFITQQVAAAMAKKTKQYEKKIKKLEKGGKDRLSGESKINGTRGGGRASKKKKTSTTQTNTKSKTPKQSTSCSAKG